VTITKKKENKCLLREEDIATSGTIKKFIRIREGALEVFLILLSAADAEDYSEMSLTEIVKLCGYSRWKVQACLSALEKSEYIIRELKGIAGHTMVYKLLKSI